METQEDTREEDEQVNINISHGGLADGLRPMAKAKMLVKITAQPAGVGSSFNLEKTLRDVTNNMEAKSSEPKPTRIITKASLGQKRPTKSPYEKPHNARQPASGSVRGCPPTHPI